jgi:hypothetical protein
MNDPARRPPRRWRWLLWLVVPLVVVALLFVVFVILVEGADVVPFIYTTH